MSENDERIKKKGTSWSIRPITFGGREIIPEYGTAERILLDVDSLKALVLTHLPEEHTTLFVLYPVIRENIEGPAYHKKAVAKILKVIVNNEIDRINR